METILITGATSGIGRAMALLLDRQGYRVIVLGRRVEALDSLHTEAPGIELLRLDLGDRAAVAAALSDVEIDVLVNNVGTMPPPGPFDAMGQEDIDRTLAVNLASVLWLTRQVVPRMRARKRGHVVFTGSSAAHAPSPNFAVYAASKGALSAFAAALRAEVAADGLRVTELVPGRVETALYEGVIGDEDRAAMYAGGHALQPEDVAEVLAAVLRLPPRACVTRLDIMPTRPQPPIKLA